jgi:hypothetical protein
MTFIIEYFKVQYNNNRLTQDELEIIKEQYLDVK